MAKAKFQLVGITAMFIACKYEEIRTPSLSDFVYITSNTYTEDEMRDMEVSMLVALDYSLGSPAPIHFLRRYSRVAEVSTYIIYVATFRTQ